MSVKNSGNDDIAQRKKNLRKHFTAVRNAISSEELSSANHDILNNLKKLFSELFTNNYHNNLSDKNFLLYHAINNEISCIEVQKWLTQLDANIFLPIMTADKHLAIGKYDDENKLVTNRIGIKEPDAIINPAPKLDLAIIPAISCDIYGNRLGYGGGYYDRSLPLWQEISAKSAGDNVKRQTIITAIIHELQLYDGILPYSNHDAKIDFIITDKRIVKCQNNG